LKLNPTQPNSGAQEFLRVDRLAVDARLVMQVRAGGAAGRADLADDLSDADGLAFADVARREVAVAGRQTVALGRLVTLRVNVFRHLAKRRKRTDPEMAPDWHPTLSDSVPR
jgi:hypothetical protein